MLPPDDYERAHRRITEEIAAGRLDPETRNAGAAVSLLSAYVRVTKVVRELGEAPGVLAHFGLDLPRWLAAKQAWGPAMNAVETHARWAFWDARTDVAADIAAIRARGG